MHARMLSVVVFLPELSTVATIQLFITTKGPTVAWATKIPADTRVHFLYSVFSAPVHGQSAGDLHRGFAYR